jgi:hypothetical protein
MVQGIFSGAVRRREIFRLDALSVAALPVELLSKLEIGDIAYFRLIRIIFDSA